MRPLRFVLILTLAACGGGEIRNLPLMWRGADDSPRPSELVAQAFSKAPFAFGMRDVRPDLTAVGSYDDGGFIVRTTDNVAEYCSRKMGEMLAHAGARMTEPPTAVLHTELVEYRVAEGGTFAGVVRIRASLRRGEVEAWSKTYVGKSKRWGRTHNPDNFNEALSNALADVTQQVVRDDELAHALLEAPAAPAPPAADAGPPGA